MASLILALLYFVVLKALFAADFVIKGFEKVIPAQKTESLQEMPINSGCTFLLGGFCPRAFATKSNTRLNLAFTPMHKKSSLNRLRFINSTKIGRASLD